MQVQFGFNLEGFKKIKEGPTYEESFRYIRGICSY